MIKPLTGVRGFAAIWVVLYHFRFQLDALVPSWQTFRQFAWSGFIGVDLFAVLSGFVISLTYQRKLGQFSLRATARFLWLRLARIYPLHLFVLVMFVGSYLWRTGLSSWDQVWRDGSLWLQVAMLNGWGLEDTLAWNVPSWTVSSEWLCYLLFPAAALLLARVRSGSTAGILAGVTILATMGLMRVIGIPYFQVLDYGFIRIGGAFLAGCWLCRAFQAGFAKELPWGWIGAAALSVGIYCSTIRHYPITIFSFVVLVYALAHDRQPLGWAFGNRVSVYLGEISYSLYMIQYFVVSEVEKSFHASLNALPPVQKTPLLFGLVFVLASITHFAVERPTRTYLRKRVGAHAHPERTAS